MIKSFYSKSRALGRVLSVESSVSHRAKTSHSTLHTNSNLNTPHSTLNSKGFALAETIVAMVILTSALAGLLIMVNYGSARAEANYRERYVMLRLDGELQKIRYNYEHEGGFGTLNQVRFNIPHLGPRNLRQIEVIVDFQRNLHFDDSVGHDTRFEAISAVAEWEEPRDLLMGRGNSSRPTSRKRYVELREDYYFRRTQ